MPARKLKPAEAGDGSYAGIGLEAFDNLPQPGRALDPRQVDQLLLLRRMGATSLAGAVHVLCPDGGRQLNLRTILGPLFVAGLTATKVKTTPFGGRFSHYWLTPAGLVQADALAGEARR